MFATDKHRMLWVIDMKTLSNIGSTGKAQSTYPRDARLNRSDVCPEFLDVAYQKGTLHVIKAAPKRDYSTRITLEPCLSASGEYLGVMLGWVGSRAYQHTAMVRSAAAEHTLGLGVLRSAYHAALARSFHQLRECIEGSGRSGFYLHEGRAGETRHPPIGRPEKMHADHQQLGQASSENSGLRRNWKVSASVLTCRGCADTQVSAGLRSGDRNSVSQPSGCNLTRA